jgi:N-acetylmuramoyl-L-alanine amidase
MRKIDLIVWHCTATPEGRDHTIADVRRWHVAERGWSDVGYHYLIRLDGTVEAGRPLERQGAHAAGHNANSIGVAYVGGVDAAMRPKDTRTEAQKAALCDLTLDLVRRFPGARVVGHRDLGAAKACPSFDAVADWQSFIAQHEWVRTDEAEPGVERAAKDATATRIVGGVAAAAPVISGAAGLPWQTVAVVGAVVVALALLAVAIRPLRLRLLAAVGAPA